jgi:hypothetical protein
MSEILGALFGLLIGLIGMTHMTSNVQVQQHLQNNITTAQEQQDWVQGVSTYVTNNMTTLESTATATTPVVINLATLQAANVTLATGFSGLNPYNQTWIAEVKQPTAGNLQVLVTATGGLTISDQDLGAIAQAAAGVGGMIPSNNSGAYPGGAANAYGNAGSWVQSTANYTNIAGGHPASLLNFSNGNLSSPYLYRNAVPGQGQLNDMNTNLGLNNNNITAVNQISTQSLQALANGSKTAPSVTLANGTVVAFNQVSEGGVLGLVGSNGEAVYLESINGTFRLVNSPWSLQLFSVDQSGNVVANGGITVGGSAGVGGNLQVNGTATINGNATVDGTLGVGGNINDIGTTNSANLMSRGNVSFTTATAYQGNGCSGSQFAESADGTGQILQCINGIWTTLGAHNTTVVTAGVCHSYGGSETSTTATCPANYRMTGGGYGISAYNPVFGGSTGSSAVSNAPDASAPNGNGWMVEVGGADGNSCFVAYAVCSQ